MAIKLVTFAGQTVTPQDDALVYEKALQKSGMIYGGIVTIKNANMLHIDAGHGALCGRKFTIEATDVPVPLTSSGSLHGRVYIHMDLSDTGQPISFQVETASSLTPVVQQSDVNIFSGIYEINLATFEVDTSTISDLVNVAPFIDVVADENFNPASTNPLQNKAITKALGDPETIGGTASKAYNKGDLILASNGQLYEATANIAQGGYIVNGGNVSATGSIISQISNFAKDNYGTEVNIIGYTSTEYTAPSDGYVIANCLSTAGTFITINVNGQNMIRAIGATGMSTAPIASLFVRKGMKVKIAYDNTGTSHNARFIPLQ